MGAHSATDRLVVTTMKLVIPSALCTVFATIMVAQAQPLANAEPGYYGYYGKREAEPGYYGGYYGKREAEPGYYGGYHGKREAEPGWGHYGKREAGPYYYGIPYYGYSGYYWG